MESNSIQEMNLKSVQTGLLGKPIKSYFMILCFSLPVILLIGAYLYMTVSYQKLSLFNTVVHENGKYTLLEVIFYFRHFSWEMPGKAIYSLFIVGLFYYYGNASAKREKHKGGNIPGSRILISGISVAGILIITVLITVYKFGIIETLHGMLQYRTSEIKPVSFGSHWRNHFLSNIVLFSASAFLICLYRIVCCGGWVKRKYAGLYFIAGGLFILLSIAFGFSADSFKTPSYLGHQLREIFGSDIPITMLLSAGTLICLELRYDRAGKAAATYQQPTGKSILYLLRWLVPVVLISGYIIIRVLSLDISGEMSKLPGAQSWSVPDIFAWHFFEHSLDYIFVVSFVYFLYLLTLRAELTKNLNEE